MKAIYKEKKSISTLINKKLFRLKEYPRNNKFARVKILDFIL